MPDTGTPFYLPYPDLPEDLDFPSDTQALATQSHAIMAAPAPRIAVFKTISMDMPTANALYKVYFDSSEPGQSTAGITQSSSGDFTISVAGLYQINCQLHFNVSAQAGNNVLIQVTQPTTELNILWSIGSTPGDATITISKSWRFNVGDKFWIYARSNLAGTDIYGSGSRYTNLDATRIAN